MNPPYLPFYMNLPLDIDLDILTFVMVTIGVVVSAYTAKKTAVLPGLRVDEGFALKVHELLKTSPLHFPAIRRELWIDAMRVAETGEQIARPARILTVEMERKLKELDQ